MIRNYSLLSFVLTCLLGLSASAQDYEFFDLSDWADDDSIFEELVGEESEADESKTEQASAGESGPSRVEEATQVKRSTPKDEAPPTAASAKANGKKQRQAPQEVESRGGRSRGNEGIVERPESTGTLMRKSDHSLFVKRYGVGFMGTSSLPVPVCTSRSLSGSSPNSISFPCSGAQMSAPMLGVRYWLSERVGVDVGVGLGFTSLDVENSQLSDSSHSYYESNEVRDDFTYLGGGLLLGLPIALANTGHFSFQIIPELKLAYAQGSWTDDYPTSPKRNEIVVSAWQLGLGARVGAEIHFGFMGLPQLALQGGVGIHGSYTSRYHFQKTTDTSQGDVENSLLEGRQNDWKLGTQKNGDPWGIFTGQVSALYYF